MKIELTASQKEKQRSFEAFVDEFVAPQAGQFDRDQCLPPQFITDLARQGYLGAVLPAEYGGQALDMITYGLLCQAMGRGSCAVCSLITVQSMVSHTILRWGNLAQRKQWLNRLTTGESVAAFALTEPEIGSDARNVQSAAILSGDDYILNGQKRWITFGQIADLFLVFAQIDGAPGALLVERNCPGLSIKPMTDTLGFRASMLAELHFDNCAVPRENLVGSVGFGFSPIALSALQLGRYSVAWNCVGLAQACLEASLQYTARRKQFGVYLKKHQLIRQVITEMTVNIKAARLLCYQAGYLEMQGDPQAVVETMAAKYFAARMVNQVASDTVQIHGAQGISQNYPVERYLRDAKITEIIEGSSQILQNTLAGYAYHES